MTLAAVDSFLLGYLPLLVRGHVGALDVVEAAQRGAEGELAARVGRELEALPARGPEIVSCVHQVEGILVERLRAAPPPPPRTMAEHGAWLQAVVSAFGQHDGDATAYALGAYAGAAEEAVGAAVRQWTLWAAKPAHEAMTRTAAGVREKVRAAASLAAAPTACPTMKGEGARIAHDLAAAVEVTARPPDDGAAVALRGILARLQACARSLEAAAWGTPRWAVGEWLEGRCDGGELARRIADHRRWSVPAVTSEGAPPGARIFSFDKRVLLAFSDVQALAERPDYARGEGSAGDAWLTLPGTALLSALSADVDLLVLDPGQDPQSKRVVHYPPERHAMLRQTAQECAVEAAATDWSHVNRDVLRAHRYWVLVAGGNVRNLVAVDGQGRARVAVFTREAALDAHLARATPEQRAELASHDMRVLLPGSQLFAALRPLQAPIVVNPSGPGRTRAFNAKMVELLAG